MNRRFDSARLLSLIAFLLLILLGFYFGVLRVREVGGSVVRTNVRVRAQFKLRQLSCARSTLGDPRNEIGIVVSAS
jgi:hypothetical protein